MAEIFDNDGVFVYELEPAFAACLDNLNLNVSPDDIRNRVKKIFQYFNFFWECNAVVHSKDIGCSLTLVDQIFVSTNDNRLLEEYRMKCLVKNYSFIGRKKNEGNFIGVKTKVENWFAGRAAQTGVADHRTRHAVLNHGNQYADEALGLGQLVVPVYYHSSSGLKLVGIIELVTTQPKESYVRDFNQIQNLLKMANLTSTYMGKTIKVKYGHKGIVKFTLPFSAKLPDLEKQVTMRFTELKSKTFCIKYEDSRYTCNNQNLEFCLNNSISNGTTAIRMFADVARK
ncbi:PB1 domain-containing protein [Artemisia annua]|uniref:PB1 domain-containing protein n=1 Tax=Artemisia annua TaxID=35608 RepID=A0A2U1MHA2_ARTAN|nr:PB1 domain-containing protein [Artemisia annua]